MIDFRKIDGGVMFKPHAHEIRVVTTTAISTLGIFGKNRLRTYMITKANNPMKNVGQCV